MTSKPLWGGGQPVAAFGRFYVICPVNAATPLTEGGANAGAVGDEVDWLWLFPATTTPGAVTLRDGGVSVYVWPAGITLNDVRPIFVPLNLRSVAGAWSVTTGLNITATAAGAFT